MSRKIAKLALAVAVLAGSFGVGMSPRVVSAATTCPNLCCDPNCYGIYPCRTGPSGGCVCSNVCEPNFPGGDN